MSGCQYVTDLLSRADDELSENDYTRLLEHATACPLCQAELRRMGLTAQVLGSLPSRSLASVEHLSDLCLASFAAFGYGADQATAAVAHLADCPQCRAELAAVGRALEEFEEFVNPERPGSRGSVSDRLSAAWQSAFSSPRGALLAVAALTAYVAECMCFAIVLATVFLTYWARPYSFDAVPQVWPVSLLPQGPVQLGVFAAGLVVLGVALRQLAACLAGTLGRSDGT